MKKIFYHGQVAELKMGDETFQAGIKELSVSFNPKCDDLEFIRFPAREDISLSFKIQLDKDFDLSKFLVCKPYRQITIEFHGYITEQLKQVFRELEEKSYVWFLQFRQRIYPKLIAEISFITIFQVEETK